MDHHPLIPPPLPHHPTTTITTTNILKRKRTKRQRLQFVSNSPPSNNAFNSPPASSSSTTTEDEDTAKCLILLSQGHNSNYNDEFSGYKFTSKKYIQTSADASTFAYVYECKTCSRTFPSFQALGGHRASHTKPKIKEFDQRQLSSSPFSDEDEITMHQFSKKNNSSSSSSSISLQLNNTKKSSSSNKLHECSICGAEFNSGQALGGHMRRHRVTNAGSGGGAANTTLSLIPYNSDQKCRNDGLCLDLDLNLPAPPETAAERRESSFKFTPTLVDCHY